MRSPNEEWPPTEAEDHHGAAAKPHPCSIVPRPSDSPIDELHEYRRHLAEVAADTGMMTAATADPEWMKRAMEWFAHLPAGTEITGDDLRSALGASSASGPAFRRAARLGLIEFVAFTISTAATRHGAPTRIWRVT